MGVLGLSIFLNVRQQCRLRLAVFCEMANDAVHAVLEQVLLTKGGNAPTQPSVVTFLVGGQQFQILEQTIRSRGQTLLSDLLDDPEHAGKSAPIYVQGDSERFKYIMDWYRFGSICMPLTMSLEAMQRECAYYGLPDDVQLKYDAIGSVLPYYKKMVEESHAEVVLAGSIVAAHVVFHDLCKDPTIIRVGKSRVQYRTDTQSSASTWPVVVVGSAIFPKCKINGEYSINDASHSKFKTILEDLAEKHGFQVDISIVAGGSVSTATVEMTSRPTKAPEVSSTSG